MESVAAVIVAFAVIENGPDSFDYQVASYDIPKRHTVLGPAHADHFACQRTEERAKGHARSLQNQHAYLGYGYTVEPVYSNVTEVH